MFWNLNLWKTEEGQLISDLQRNVLQTVSSATGLVGEIVLEEITPQEVAVNCP